MKFIKHYIKQVPLLFRKRYYIYLLITIGLLLTIPLLIFQRTYYKGYAQGVSIAEPESATLSGSVVTGTDNAASGQQYIQFNTPTATSNQQLAPYYATFAHP